MVWRNFRKEFIEFVVKVVSTAVIVWTFALTAILLS